MANERKQSKLYSMTAHKDDRDTERYSNKTQSIFNYVKQERETS